MEVERETYKFIGANAEQSAKYYDTVVSRMPDFDKDYIAWEAAHKFGSRMVGRQIASFRDGIVHEENALAAAEYIDNERGNLYKSLPEYNRGNTIRAKMPEIISTAEQTFHVVVKHC